MSFPRVGDIGLSHRRSGFYSRAVSFFTQSYWTHGFIICAGMDGETAALEADLKVQLVPFSKEYGTKNNDAFEIYRPIKASESNKAEASRATYWMYAGDTYGFLQIAWFIWDWFCKKIRIKSGRNWFPTGVICSELQLYYLQSLNDPYKEAFKHLTLNEVNPDAIADIVRARPDLFELIMLRT